MSPSTPAELARAAPGGGFVEFEFGGTLRGAAVRGRGFAERGGPA